MSGNELIKNEEIQNRIYTIRGVQVMLDEDLAKLYDVEVKRLNEQVKRNIQRFPESFRFLLTDSEMEILISQIVMSNEDRNLKSQFATSSWGGRRTKPYAFNEQGIAMLSTVLKSETAVKVRNRFAIIDNTTVYHFGASLKDIGKKWFAFSKMDIGAVEMLTRLGGMT